MKPQRFEEMFPTIEAAFARLVTDNPRDPAPTVRKARYARSMCAVQCPSHDGYKTRAARLVEHANGRFSGRERAYIVSPTKALLVAHLWATGRDASAITGQLYPLTV